MADPVTTFISTDSSSSTVKRVIPDFAENEEFMHFVEEQWKRRQGVPTDPYSTTEKIRVQYVSEGVSWGIVTPVLLIGIFLLGVAGCLFWCSWKEKKRGRTRHHPNTPNWVLRGFQTKINSRSKISSNTFRANVNEKITVYPLNKSYSDKCLFTDEATLHSRKLSPIRESDNDAGETSPMLPDSRNVSPHPPYSPYHIVYVTPNQRKHHAQKVFHSIKGSYVESDTTTDFYRGFRQISFPRNNTLEEESDNFPSSRINNMSSILNASSIYPSSLARSTPMGSSYIPGGSKDYTESAYYPMHKERFIAEDSELGSNFHPISQASLTDSESLSLPSSISRYHQSRLNGRSLVGGPVTSSQVFSPRKFVLANQGELELDSNNNFSDNTSLLPNIGSSLISGSMPTSQKSNSLGNINNSRESFLPLSILKKQAPVNVGSSTSLSKRQEHSNSNNSHIAGLIKSWSVTADVDYSYTTNTNSALMNSKRCNSSSALISSGLVNSGYVSSVPKEGSFLWDNYPSPVVESSVSEHNVASTDISLRDANFNEVAVVTVPTRAVKFDVPVLRDKQYWL